MAKGSAAVGSSEAGQPLEQLSCLSRSLFGNWFGPGARRVGFESSGAAKTPGTSRKCSKCLGQNDLQGVGRSRKRP